MKAVAVIGVAVLALGAGLGAQDSLRDAKDELFWRPTDAEETRLVARLAESVLALKLRKRAAGQLGFSLRE